jgi:PAS domain S-box-containing protein
MFDSRTKARSLAFLLAAGALAGLLAVILPVETPVEQRPIVALAALTLAIGFALLRYGARISDPLWHVALAGATIVLSLMVHFTHQTTLYALLYMWPALYAFFFFSTPAAIGHLAFIGAAYGMVLGAEEEMMGSTVRLLLVLGTPLVVGIIITRLLGSLRTGLERSARQEQALRNSEQRTRLIVDSARDGFISTDAAARVTDMNAAAEGLLGISRTEAIGRPFQELGVPRYAHAKFEARRRDLLEAARADRPHHLELRVAIDRPDGTRLQAETMIWVVERDGELMFNARLTDIGERLRLEHERENLVRSEAAREEAERAAVTIARLQAVADAGLTQRDFDTLAPTLLARTREVLGADGAALLLFEDDGSLSIVADDGVDDPDRVRRVAAEAGLGGRVLAAGGPVFLQDPAPEDMADPLVLKTGISSMLGVPLIAHGKTIGVIEVGVKAPRTLGPEDADLLRLTADRVALAVDHARAFGREHRIAETLQRSLLPQTLPQLPGIELSARYLPAAAESEVGGDWYDAVSLGGGRVLLVMGDVSGKGLAAASALGALRNAIRAYAFDDNGPAEIAERLNRFVLAEPACEQMATLVLAVFDPVDGKLSWVNAGHPPPLTLDAEGTARFLDGARSVPLGVMPFAGYEEEVTTLEPGGAILLYTDGLIERRGEHLDEGLALLAGAAGSGLLDPDAICDRLLAAAIPGGDPSDDVALLALCHVPLGTQLVIELPSEPRALGSLRALLRRWLEQADADDRDVHAIVMACSEACTNAIEHAGAGSGETIAFEARLEDGAVEISVRDRGRWRDQRPPSDQGRGLDLIDALMDDVQLESLPDGTTIRLRRRLTERVGA